MSFFTVRSQFEIDTFSGRLLEYAAFLEHKKSHPDLLPMPISPELLEILACPVCKARVDPTPDGNGLKCSQCCRVYPIRDDIPIMLVDEATIEGPAGSAA